MFSGSQRHLPSYSSGSSVATNSTVKSGASGRAIVGSSSVHQQSAPHSAANLDIARLMEQQMLRVSQVNVNLPLYFKFMEIFISILVISVWFLILILAVATKFLFYIVPFS